MRDPQLNDPGHVTANAPVTPGTVGGPEGAYEDKDALFNPLQAIRRRLLIIVLVAVVVVAAAAAFSFLQTPKYEASVKILVGQEQGNNVTNNIQNEVLGLEKLAGTMTEAVKTRPIAQDVIQRLGLSESPGTLRSELDVKQVASSQFVEVTFKDPSPEKAQLVANTFGDVFVERAAEVSPSANAISATVWERAVEPNSPISPDPVRNVLLGLVLGLMLGVGLALLLEYRDDKWRSPEEVEQVSGLPSFGVIPAFEAHKK